MGVLHGGAGFQIVAQIVCAVDRYGDVGQVELVGAEAQLQGGVGAVELVVFHAGAQPFVWPGDAEAENIVLVVIRHNLVDQEGDIALVFDAEIHDPAEIRPSLYRGEVLQIRHLC